jgi:hypothetical protein
MPCYGLLGIEICIPSVDDIVNALVTPITNFVTSSLNGLVSTLSSYFSVVINTLSPFFQTVIDTITGFVSDPLGFIQNILGSIWSVVSVIWLKISSALSSLWSQIYEGLSSIGSQLSTGLQNLLGSINSGLSSLGSYLSSVVNDASAVIQNGINYMGAEISSALEDAQGALLVAFDGMGNAISGAMGGLFKGFGISDPSNVFSSATGTGATLQTIMESLGLRHSPMTPVEAMEWVNNFHPQVTSAYMTIFITNMVTEAVSLGQVDFAPQASYRLPSTAAAVDTATELIAMPIKEGVMPLFKRYILSSYQPYIPPYADLIEIYVKEGYMESHWTEIPEEMIDNFRELGYSEYWALRLWGKHWVYPSPSQLYDMLHRSAGNFPEIGVTSDVLKNMLKLHDFEPMWRGPLEAISWSTWRIYDIRTGWEMDILSDEGLVKRLIDTGYEPKDAELLANIQKMFVLRTEIDGLLSESDTDFMGGWISEDQLKADYGATPYNPSIVEMRIAKAKLRQERTDKADLKAALINRFTKGDLTETEFKEALSRLGVQQNRIAIEVEKVNATKLKKVTEDTTVTFKSLTEATYNRAFKVGLISEADYRVSMESYKYSPEDIDLLVELNSPAKPAPEEIKTLTVAELKSAYRVGVLSETELRAELASRGYSPEDLEVIVSTEKAKIKPKVGE